MGHSADQLRLAPGLLLRSHPGAISLPPFAGQVSPASRHRTLLNCFPHAATLPVSAGVLEQAGPSFSAHALAGPPACDWQPARAGTSGRPLTLDVRQTPLGSGTEWSVPVSCPSRLQHSPARHGSVGTFDPFAAPQKEPPGCTPLAGQPAGRPAAPPAVHRKPISDDSPPQAAAPAAAALFAGRVQSCPPERVGRRGARHVVRLRYGVGEGSTGLREDTNSAGVTPRGLFLLPAPVCPLQGEALSQRRRGGGRRRPVPGPTLAGRGSDSRVGAASAAAGGMQPQAVRG